MDPFPTLYAAGGVALAVGLTAGLVATIKAAMSRLALSRAKHPSLSGHSRMARRIARLLPFYEYPADRFFAADAAPDDVVARRGHAFMRLSGIHRARFAKTIERTTELEANLSDLQFTGAYRVPFQFRQRVREHFPPTVCVEASEGVLLVDLDGNRLYDLTGSFGVNLLGYDTYKGCLRRGAARVEALGPVLGHVHPLTLANARRLCAISGQDEVSFHMSGTEAVMQAVGLARYHTRRSHVVRFNGAYHGWWGDVQPGVGNPLAPPATYTLRDMDAASLRVLRRRRDIACVLVNPLQALHPNKGAPADSSLIDSGRSARFCRHTYTAWLQQLRDVCTERGIPLIFDEVFTGFRLALGGAQEYFGVRADLVTYGKTVGGGAPVGVLCGRRELMKRFRDDRPADVFFARGTFNTHPYLMGSMHEFLSLLEEPAIQAIYQDLDTTWADRATRFNARLEAEALPVRVANLGSIWTVVYTQPSRYNWMLQYYLRNEGLALSWVGTGRLIFSLDYTAADFEAVATRFVAAAQAMRDDGWWHANAALSNRSIRWRVLKEAVHARLRSDRSRPVESREPDRPLP